MKTLSCTTLATLTSAFTFAFAVSGASADDVIVDQIDKTFVINGEQVESIKVSAGDSVSFRNSDPFFHNIFSLSATQMFDLGSYPSGESRSVSFETQGLVEVECAIHPDMYMTIEVE